MAGRSAPEPAENAGQVGAVRRAELTEEPFGLRSLGRAYRVEDTMALLSQVHQGGPPVARIGRRCTRPRSSRASTTSVADRGAIRR